MKNIFKELTIAAVLLALVIWLFFKGLNVYTSQGIEQVAPNLKGVRIDKAIDIIEKQGLRYVIIDTMYAYDLKPLTVASQKPKEGSKVKKNRIIYLIIVSNNKRKLIVPKMTDKSLNLAKIIIKNRGFQLGKISEKADAISDGVVLSQKHKGKEIESGSMLEEGSKIDLTISRKEGTLSIDSTSVDNDPPMEL